MQQRNNRESIKLYVNQKFGTHYPSQLKDDDIQQKRYLKTINSKKLLIAEMTATALERPNFGSLSYLSSIKPNQRITTEALELENEMSTVTNKVSRSFVKHERYDGRGHYGSYVLRLEQDRAANGSKLVVSSMVKQPESQFRAHDVLYHDFMKMLDSIRKENSFKGFIVTQIPKLSSVRHSGLYNELSFYTIDHVFGDPHEYQEFIIDNPGITDEEEVFFKEKKQEVDEHSNDFVQRIYESYQKEFGVIDNQSQRDRYLFNSLTYLPRTNGYTTLRFLEKINEMNGAYFKITRCCWNGKTDSLEFELEEILSG